LALDSNHSLERWGEPENQCDGNNFQHRSFREPPPWGCYPPFGAAGTRGRIIPGGLTQPGGMSPLPFQLTRENPTLGHGGDPVGLTPTNRKAFWIRILLTKPINVPFTFGPVCILEDPVRQPVLIHHTHKSVLSQQGDVNGKNEILFDQQEVAHQ
jgi:hypothetical protein